MLILAMMIAVSVAANEQDQWDPATDHMLFFKNRTECPVGIITAMNGAPVCEDEATSTLNKPLLSNAYYMEVSTRQWRERIPERTVHARGSGAFGYFELTHDMSHICKADFLKGVGKQTPIAVRFSLATGERGISELNRDIRSMAIKFYTTEGNFDLPAVNTPTFLSKDPLHFSLFAHALRRNPATNLFDLNALWDALSMHPESFLTYLYLLTDFGLPAGYDHMPAFGIHTHQVENEFGNLSYVKYHVLPKDGFAGLPTNVTDPDHYTRSLFRRIAKKDFPVWKVYMQILSEADLEVEGPVIFDITRYIPLNKYPLHEVGEIVLNRNPKNYHADVEQMGFCPGNLVSGMHGAPDAMFQARIIAYVDAMYHRLGVNFNKIAVNRPLQKTFSYNRDGSPPVLNNDGDGPNYYPNSFNGPVASCTTKSKRELISIVEEKAYNFDQVREFFYELPTDQQDSIVENVVLALQQVAPFIQQRTIKVFADMLPELSSRVVEGLNAMK